MLLEQLYEEYKMFLGGNFNTAIFVKPDMILFRHVEPLYNAWINTYRHKSDLIRDLGFIKGVVFYSLIKKAKEYVHD